MQVGADRQGVVRIDGGVALFDVLDDAVFVYDDVGPLRPLVGVALNIVALEDAVGGQHLLIHIAQKRELDVDLLGEGGIGRGGIHADAENFRIGGVNFAAVDSRLDRLELLGSATGERENVNGEQDVFLALEIAQLDGFPLVAQQREVGSRVANFEGDLGNLLILSGSR